MVRLSALWLFYKRLIIPSLLVSLFFGLLLTPLSKNTPSLAVGISYMAIAPGFHYFIYEISHYNEYYFFYNLGLSKIVLWANTIILSFLTGVLICLI